MPSNSLPSLPDIFQDSPILWIRRLQAGKIEHYLGEEWLSYKHFSIRLRMEVDFFRRRFQSLTDDTADCDLMVLVCFYTGDDCQDMVNVPYSFFL